MWLTQLKPSPVLKKKICVGVNMKNHIHLLLLCRSTIISGERGKGRKCDNIVNRSALEIKWHRQRRKKNINIGE